MVIQNIEALVQFTNENGENWIESEILPENLLVYDDINRVFKKGNGSDLYNDLPIWIDINSLENIYNNAIIIDFDIFSGENLDKIIIINKDQKITISDLTLTELKKIYNLINNIGDDNYDETIRISNVIKITFFNYSDKVLLNSTMMLAADSINACNVTDNDLEYKWYINDELYEDNSKVISYTIPDDINLVGSIIEVKCIVYCEMLNISSIEKKVEIEIVDNGDLVKPIILNTAITEVFG